MKGTACSFSLFLSLSHSLTLSLRRLGNCSITDEACAALASAFRTNPSHLRELDLSGNKVGNSGVKHLYKLLTHSKSPLEKLHLSFCSIKEEGYAGLASVLKSNPSSHLIELDLRGNDPGNIGVKMLTDLLEDHNCKLKTLRLLKSSAAEEVCNSLTKVLGINPLLQRELDLSGKIGDSEMNKISDLLQDSHCRTQKLKLNKSSITEKVCAALSSALCSNYSHLIELDLSENKLGNSGVKQITKLLSDSNSNLEKLNISDCNITGAGYADLASALKSNPSSHLIELDLRGNDPGDKGVEELTDLQKDPKCKLKTLRLLKSSDAEKAYNCLNMLLRKNPLLQKELDLSRTELKDIKVQQLCALLEDPHYRLKKLKLYKSGNITERECAALISALIVNPSHLRDLDLNENKLNESGVQKLCILLKNHLCKLEKLTLNKTSIKGKGCADLASALSSKPSHLRELDLSENEIEDLGLKHFCAVLKAQECKLEKLLLKNCGIEEEGCAALAAALKSNSSHLKELNLCENKLGISLNELAEVLKNSGCKIQLDSTFMTRIKGGLKSVFSWLGGTAEKSKTVGETMTVKTEMETGGEDTGDKQTMEIGVDEANRPTVQSAQETRTERNPAVETSESMTMVADSLRKSQKQFTH
ncbi:ribonuclease inhibitor-like [Colossoma macropomum]|uniref:ribonuclease inhibitor-like n=1 Tax=Colossoma macropomum TaxID=42526 RepID=UPI001865275F|nr:ribonuclease inhibitor-like [Colossoma macropomum]